MNVTHDTGRRWGLSWLILFALAATAALTARTVRAAEPVVGGPCEGCELVFVGMPDDIPSQARIAPVDETGQPLVIDGTVRWPDGRAAAGAIVYAYHTNAGGIYPAGSTRHGRLRGWARTDAEGHYRFTTIRPGAYPGRSSPQHIHMHVIEPGRVTYSIDSIVFSDDERLTAERLERMQRGRGGSGLTHPVRDARGVWHVSRDIHLGANIPGYPEDNTQSSAAAAG